MSISLVTQSAKMGDIIIITSTLERLDGVAQIQLSFVSPTLGPTVVTIPSYAITLQQATNLVFYVPPGQPNATTSFGLYSGAVTVTLIGNNVLLSGIFVLGTINFINSQGSGIYVLSESSTSDTVYLRGNIDVQLMVTQSFVDDDILDSPAVQSEDIGSGNFYAMLSYPTAILAQLEEYESDNNIISYPQFSSNPTGLPIPSPFAKMGLLP